MKTTTKSGSWEASTKAIAAYQDIRKMILAGILPGGTALDQGRLAATLGLSTTPIREALRRLEAESLVTISAHREATVAAMSAKELDELYSVRLVLDPYAAVLAVRNATDEEVRQVKRELALAPHDLEGHDIDSNRKIHRAIYAASHNRTLITLLDSLWDRCDRYRFIFLEKTGVETAHQEHSAIVAAFCQRNSELVCNLMYDHVAASRQKIKLLVHEAEVVKAG